MKYILALILSLCGVAQAETITLMPVECNAQRNCLSVPNDTEAALQINAPPSKQSFWLIVDGVQLNSPTGASLNGIYQSAVYDRYGNFGGTLDLVFSHYVKCNISGHNVCRDHWFIVSGTFVRP